MKRVRKTLIFSFVFASILCLNACAVNGDHNGSSEAESIFSESVSFSEDDTYSEGNDTSLSENSSFDSEEENKSESLSEEENSSADESESLPKEESSSVEQEESSSLGAGALTSGGGVELPDVPLG